MFMIGQRNRLKRLKLELKSNMPDMNYFARNREQCLEKWETRCNKAIIFRVWTQWNLGNSNKFYLQLLTTIELTNFKPYKVIIKSTLHKLTKGQNSMSILTLKTREKWTGLQPRKVQWKQKVVSVSHRPKI